MILIFLFILVAAPVNAQIPSAIGWHQLTNTKIRPVCGITAGFTLSGNCDGITAAWNSGVLDTTLNRLIVWGGGHTDYFGNEVYALNLDANPVTLTRLNNPSQPQATGAGCEESLTNPFGPNSRHTYNNIQYVPYLNQMVSHAGSVACTNSRKSSATWMLNLASLAWTQESPTGASIGTQEGAISGYDRNSGNMIFHDVDNGLYRYNPRTKIYTKDTTDAIDYHMVGVFDPVRNIFWAFGHGFQWKWPFVNGVAGTRQAGGTSGGSTILAPDYIGCDYDAVQDKIVCWRDGNTVWILNLDTLAWSSQTFTGGPTSVAVGPLGRWRYSPKSNAFVVCNDVDVDCWALRLTDPNTAKHDFVKRAYGPNVIRSFDFDTTNQFTNCQGGSNGCYTYNYGIISPHALGDYTKAIRDTTQAASGASSLKFVIPTNSDSDTSGEWLANFSSDLQTQFGGNSSFFVQWRNRLDPALLSTSYLGSDGFKQIIIGVGDVTPTSGGSEGSCTSIDWVIQNVAQRGFLQTEHGCAHFLGLEPRFFNANIGGQDIYLNQNALPSPYCSYAHLPQGSLHDGTFPPGKGNCVPYFASEWMTFQIGLDLGSFATAANCNEVPWIGGLLGHDCYKNSRIRIWIARDGQPEVLVTDYTQDMYAHSTAPAQGGNGNNKFGKLHLTPYQTKKDSSQAHAETYMWVDELIISRTQIAAPGQPAAPGSQVVLTITSPTSNPTYSTSTATVNLGGTLQ